jgi:hypothetical protein
MTWKLKISLVVYLTCWTTLVAWLTSFLAKTMFMDMGMPFSRLFVDFPAITLVFSFPIALYSAANLFRRGRPLTPDALTRYFLGTPAKIFLVLLVVASAMTTIFVLLTFFIGLLVGLIPLFVGTMVHCLGILPLWLFDIETDDGKRPLGCTSSPLVNKLLCSLFSKAKPSAAR